MIENEGEEWEERHKWQRTREKNGWTQANDNMIMPVVLVEKVKQDFLNVREICIYYADIFSYDSTNEIVDEMDVSFSMNDQILGYL